MNDFYRKYKDGINAVAVIGVLLLIVRYLVGSPEPADHLPPERPPSQTAEKQKGIGQLLVTGKGHDWLQLTHKERLHLCNVIENAAETEHTAQDYFDFINTFYTKAQSDGNNQLLNRPISEVAATGAVMMDSVR